MLPLAGLDPEGICLDEGKDGRSHQAPSPTVSHAGSSLEALVEDRWGQHYFAVSMSDAALNRSEGGGDRTGSFELSVDSTQDNISPCQSFTGPDSNMQMVPRRGARQGGEEEATSAVRVILCTRSHGSSDRRPGQRRSRPSDYTRRAIG
jgi:hypothetical protein